MSSGRLYLLVLANLACNCGLIWLLYRLRTRRRQAAREALGRSAGLLGQRARELEAETMIHGKEVIA